MKSTIGERLRAERVRLDYNQIDFAAAGGAKKHSQINYEADRTFPDASYLAALAGIGVDVLYVLTGVRADPSLAPAQPEPLDPLMFMFCADLVAQEYAAAGIDLPPMARKIEALWAHDELRARVTNPEDGDEIEAVMPQVRHLLKRRLLQADSGGIGTGTDQEVTE